MNRQRQEVVILEVFEAAQDELRAGHVHRADRLLTQGIRALDVYAQEGIVIERARKLGLSAPSVVRSLEEFKRERLTAGNGEPSSVA